MKRMLAVALLACLPACGSDGSAGDGSGGASGGAGAGGRTSSGGSGGHGGAGGGSGGSSGSSGLSGAGGRGGSTGLGGGSGGGTGAGADLIRKVCEASCARGERCAPEEFPTAAEKAACVSSCIAASPPADKFADGVLAFLASCVRDLACDVHDDLCLVEAAQEQDPNWIASPDGKACTAKHAECAQSDYPVGYADEACGLFSIFSPSTLASFKACLAKPCPEVSSCVGSVIPL